MKESQLRKIIKEEIKKVLNEKKKLNRTDRILLQIGYEQGHKKTSDDETIIRSMFRYLAAGDEHVIKRFNELSKKIK